MFCVESHIARTKNLYKPPHGRAVYGGQVIAQAMTVAHKSLMNDHGNFHCNSLHCYFLLPGDVNSDISYSSKPLRIGNNYIWLEISASQHDKEIFRMMISFARTSFGNFLKFQTKPRFLRSKLPKPETLLSVTEYLGDMRESIDSELAIAISSYSTYPIAVEIRIPHRAFLRDCRKFRTEGLGLFEGEEFQVLDKPVVRQMWMKIPSEENENLQSGGVPAAAALLAFLSDWPLLGTSVKPYGRTLRRKSQSKKDFHDKELKMMASLDHSMWFHGGACLGNRLEGWWLFEMRCLVLCDGRATVEGHIWDESGVLLATIVQEGVVRVISSKL